MRNYSALLALIVLFTANNVFSQNKPQLKPQISLDGVQDVISDSRQNAFVVKSYDNYTLIDQGSKIQLGSIILNFEKYAIPGQGTMHFWGNKSFLISTGQQIIETDIIEGTIDTLFQQVEFPEFIINFVPLPWNENVLLIATKIYPVDKTGNVSFTKTGAGDKVVYDDSRNGRLLLFDVTTKKIIKSANTNYISTAIALQANHFKLTAGTFEGDIIEIDSSLVCKKLCSPFQRPVHSVVRLQNQIAASPHYGPKYIGSLGEGTVYLVDLLSNTTKSITLPEEQAPRTNDQFQTVGATNTIAQIFALPGNTDILINYGHTRLLKLNVLSLDSSHLPVPYNVARFYCFNRDSTQLLAATTEKASVFGVNGDLRMYDLRQRKFQNAFQRPAAKIHYKTLTKVFDAEGNYHFVAALSDRHDTLVVYSSNKTNPSFLIAAKGELTVNAKDTTLLLKLSNSGFVYGKLELQNLLADRYVFNATSGDTNSDELHKELFQIELDSRKQIQKNIPWGITAIGRLSNNFKLVQGYTYKKDNTLLWARIIAPDGRLVIDKPDLEMLILPSFARVSPSGNHVAFAYKKGKSDFVEVWEINSPKKVFEYTVPTSFSLQHLTFDAKKEIFWFNQSNLEKPVEFFKVDLGEKIPKARLHFTHCCIISFETDIENDLMAAENYDNISLHRLSTQQQLWKIQSESAGIRISNLPGGFGYATETSFNAITAKMHHLQFTSYDGYKPAELLDSYLYKADKSAIGNLAFVLNRKGYLPTDFDMYFNRPDSILLLSGSRNESYNDLMRKAVEKRIRFNKSKPLSEVLTERPLLSIDNRRQLSDVTRSNSITLSIKANAQTGKKLKAIHVTDNGSPVFGRNGRALDPVDSTIIQVTIPLSVNINNLEITVSDESGNKSASENISVFADYAAPASKLYFIGIGIDQFSNSDYNLKYSVKDIRDLSSKLREKYGNNIVIDTIFNENVSVANIKALKSRLLQTNTNDKVIISYSGHGLLNAQFDYYLSTWSVNFEKPEQNGLPYSDLEGLLDSIPAQRKLLLIDACHSGEVDKEDLVTVELNGNDSLVKGGKLGVVKKQSQVGLKNSFELMQSLFVNVGNNTGATIISAAAGTQFALESNTLRNGVFTYSILEAMQAHPSISVGELKRLVGARVVQLTRGKQQPTSRNETIALDWAVWE